jgi:hypothetical protein
MLISFNTSWKIWQPADFLPNSESDNFWWGQELREIAKDLPYDFWVTLVGDTIPKKLYRLMNRGWWMWMELIT